MPRWHWANYGREKLWLVGCLVSEPRQTQSKTGDRRVCQVLRWSRRFWGRGVRAVPRLYIVTLVFTLQMWKNQGKTSLTLSERLLGWSALNTIRLVDLSIADDGLDWPACPYRPWLSHEAPGSTLFQCKYLPNCFTKGFPTSANVESKLAVRAVMWLAKTGTPRSLWAC